MASYVVMEPDAVGRTERAVFVRDGFSILAFLVPFVWLFWNRLWIEGALALGATLLLGVIEDYGRLGWTAVGLSLLVSIYVGLEGPALHMAALRRRGWREAAVIDADSREDAETRYILGEAEIEPQVEPTTTTTQAHVRPRPASGGPALGLLGYDGRR